MVRREKAQAAALILTAACITSAIITYYCGIPNGVVALSKDCTILARLSYSFFHANLLHAIVNCWCLLSIVFIYDISVSDMMVSFLVAVTFPIGFLYDHLPLLASSTPTVGLSAVVYCLLAQVSFQCQRKMLFHCWVLSFIGSGFIVPYLFIRHGIDMAVPNNLLHIYCYVVGLLVGFLNSPAPWRRK